MSSSPYENVFFYFRGPSANAVGESQQSRQIEDNTTKALVNLFQLADPSLVASWLASLGVSMPAGGLPAEFHLQGGPAGCSAPHRRLLVITAEDDISAATWHPSTSAAGRIDAAIHVPGELLVAIEAKVAAALDGGQLEKHAADWDITRHTEPGIEGVADSWIFTTWAQIYRWARTYQQQDGLTAVSKFLIAQFTEYLEIIGVTPFAGFRPEDFDLLADRRAAIAPLAPDPAVGPTDPAQAALVKARVAKLWDAILPRLTTGERAALGAIHVGSLRARDDRMWAATNWGERGLNFTLELDPDQLELDLVAWTSGQVNLLERWLESSGAGAGALGELDGWSLVVWRRRAMADKSGEPYWMHNTYEQLETIPMPPPDDLLARLAVHRAACEPEWELIAYHLRIAWAREAVLAAGEELAEEASAALKSAIPLLHPINWFKTVPVPATTALSAKNTPGLEGMGFQLMDDSDPDPCDWRFIAAGPSLLVTSPSGMHLRGIRYYVAVWPGPGAGQAVYVACSITKSYASGGREGFVERHYYGPDIRAAVKAIATIAQGWERSEHFPEELQPERSAKPDVDDLVSALKLGVVADEWGWETLDGAAREAFRQNSVDEPSWKTGTEPVKVSYRREL